MLSNSSLFVFFLSVKNFTFSALSERHREAYCMAFSVFAMFLEGRLFYFLATLDLIHFFRPAMFSYESSKRYSVFFGTLLFPGCLCNHPTSRLIINYS